MPPVCALPPPHAILPGDSPPSPSSAFPLQTSAPATGFTSAWTFLHCNAAWEAAFEGVMERRKQPNLVWRLFLGGGTPVLRSKEEERAFAAGLVADLRGAAGRYPGDEDLQVLIDELLEKSEAFTALWKSAQVAPHWAKRKTLSSRVGVLELDCDVLTTEGDLRLVLYTAEAGSESERRLAQLLACSTRP